MTAPVPSRVAAPASSLEQRVEIETPEHVAFSYTVAGIGSRAAAAIVDQIIIGLSIVAIFFVVAFLFAMIAGGDIGKGFEAVFGSWATAVMIFAMFALSWGYYVFFEALSDGQTPGKKMFGLRVVQDGGYSISFGASAVRNIIRILDAQPGIFYVVGMVSAVFSRTAKRVGDHVAGTIVVHERVPEFAPALAASSDARRDAALPVTALLTED